MVQKKIRPCFRAGPKPPPFPPPGVTMPRSTARAAIDRRELRRGDKRVKEEMDWIEFIEEMDGFASDDEKEE